jgi:hypothetical protein
VKEGEGEKEGRKRVMVVAAILRSSLFPHSLVLLTPPLLSSKVVRAKEDEGWKLGFLSWAIFLRPKYLEG